MTRVRTLVLLMIAPVIIALISWAILANLQLVLI